MELNKPVKFPKIEKNYINIIKHHWGSCVHWQTCLPERSLYVIYTVRLYSWDRRQLILESVVGRVLYFLLWILRRIGLLVNLDLRYVLRILRIIEWILLWLRRLLWAIKSNRSVPLCTRCRLTRYRLINLKVLSPIVLLLCKESKSCYSFTCCSVC